MAMMPRSYAIATRKLAYFCRKNGSGGMREQTRAMLRDFYSRLMGIDVRLLAPQQCINILYFLRISSSHALQLEIPLPQTTSFSHSIFDQCLKAPNIDVLDFNKCCDLFQQLVRHRAEFGIERGGDEQRVLGLCLREFPTEVSEGRQADSIFHVSSLFMNLMRSELRGQNRELVKLVAGMVEKSAKYYPFSLKIKLIDLSIGNFNDLKQKDQITDSKRLISQLLKQLCLQLQQTQQDDEYNNSISQIEQIIDDFRMDDCEEVMLRLAITVNNIKKIPLTEKQLTKLRENQIEEESGKDGFII